MLDIRLIREKPEYVRERLATRGGDAHLRVDEVLESDRAWRAAETRAQGLQADRKRLSKEIGMLKAKGQDTSPIEAQVRGIGQEIDTLTAEASALEQRQRDLLLQIPNLPHDGAPIGKDASDNPEVRVWGAKPEHGFKPRTHIEL